MDSTNQQQQAGVPAPAGTPPPAAPQNGAVPVPRAGGPIAPYKSAALFVGDLHPDVQERDLFEIFNAVAPVSSVRVCRHAITRTSLGYAYVNFHSIDDADRVMENMNYTNIKGRMCRLMWSQRDPAFRRSGQGNIFIRGLAKTIDSKDLHDSLSVWGNIISCKVVVDRQTGESKGYGFVHFETKEGARQAIEKLNGNLISGQKVTVGEFVKLDERKKQQQWTNLFVKNIPLDWDEAKFRSVFAVHGEISSIKLMVDDEGKSKGYGFCDMETHEIAKAAVEALHDTKQEEPEDPEKPKLLYVKRFMKAWERQKELKLARKQQQDARSKLYQGRNLYVKNLHDSCTEEQLIAHFSEFGTVTSCKIQKDKGQSKGFGFVCFSQKEDALKALQLHQKMFMDKPLHVAMWQPKADRSQLLKSRAQRGGAQQMAPMGMNYGMPMGYPGAGRGYPPMRPMYRMQRGYPQGHYMQPHHMMQRQQQFPPAHYPQQNMPPGKPPQNMRAPEGRPQPQIMQQQPVSGQQGPAGGELTAPALAAAPHAEQKMMIGNSLYPKIGEIVSKVEDTESLRVSDLAGKITGMLLDGIPEIADLVSLLDNEDLLKQRVNSAVEVLRQDQSNRM